MPNLERTQSAPAGSIEVERRRKNSLDPTETEAELTVATAKDVASEEVTKEAAKEVTKEVIDTNLSRPVDFTQVAVLLNHSPTQDEEGEEDDEDEEGEGGAHDTITSLAGVQMLQKYQRQIRGHGLARRGSHGSKTRLQELFKEEPLLEEEEKAAVTDEEPEDEAAAEEEVFIPPDGGYGWCVTLGAFICLFWTAGLVKSYGVIFAEMMKIYPEEIRLASWIPAAMTTTALAMAPVASALCQRLNCRLVTAAGSILAALGLMLSVFMPTLPLMFFTLGILTGAGIGLSTTPGIILTARYFDKKRSRANAFCLSGTAAGSFTLPILIETLLSVYGFRGTLLILGACMLHVCISAALYRPLAIHVVIVRKAARALARTEGAVVRRSSSVTDRPSSVNLEATGSASNISKIGLLRRLSGAEEDYPKEIKPQEYSRVSSRDEYSRSSSKYDSSKSSSKDEYSRATSKDESLKAPNEYLRSLSKEDFQHQAMSSSCPQTGFLENNRGVPNEEYSLPLSKVRYIDNSFDTISMLSSVSNRSGEQDKYLDLEGQPLCRDHQGPDPWPRRTSAHNLKTEPVAAKSLSLRELAFHQIGSQLNLYRTMVLGHSPRPPSTTDPAKEDTASHKKSSFMFSCEDIMVDSTSILKDSRHPSHTHLGQTQTHRVVSLNRTQSAVGEVNRRTPCTRQRFYSESERDPLYNKNMSLCSLAGRDSRVSLVGSTELVAGTPEKTLTKFTIKPATFHIDTSTGGNGANNGVKNGGESDNAADKSEPKSSESLCDKVNKYIDVSLCSDPVFLVMAGSVMMMAVGMPHILFFLPTHAINVGLSSPDASLLLSLSAIFDLGGRLIFGFMLDLNLFPTYLAYGSMIFLAGFAALALPSVTTFTGLSACMACYGVGTGSWFLMVPLLLAEQLGVEKISSSYGLVRLFQSITNLFGPMISGYLYSTTGGLEASFYMMGCSIVIGGIISCGLPLAIARNKRVLTT